SGADRAGIVDDLAAPLAARTGALQGEKTLGVTNLSVAAAGRAGFGFRSCLGAAAGAGLAGHRGWNADLCGLAGERLFEADLHVVAQVGAALAPGGGAAARSRHPENALENIGEGRAEIGAEAGCAARPAVLEGGMAEAIVGGALVAIFQHVVGLVDFLEAALAVLVGRVAVRMVFHRQLAERGLELRVAGSAPYSEDFVIIPFGHYRHASLRCGQGGSSSFLRNDRAPVRSLRPLAREANKRPGAPPHRASGSGSVRHRAGLPVGVRPTSCSSCRRLPR